jgi:hypothetical protein
MMDVGVSLSVYPSLLDALATNTHDGFLPGLVNSLVLVVATVVLHSLLHGVRDELAGITLEDIDGNGLVSRL